MGNAGIVSAQSTNSKGENVSSRSMGVDSQGERQLIRSPLDSSFCPNEVDTVLEYNSYQGNRTLIGFGPMIAQEAPSSIPPNLDCGSFRIASEGM